MPSVMVPSRPYPTSMRIFLSLGATINKTPLSLPFCPSFHVLNTVTAYSSIETPSRVGTVSTAIWLVVFSSWAFRLAVTALRVSSERICALSVTRPVRKGTSTAKAGKTARAKAMITKKMNFFFMPPSPRSHWAVHEMVHQRGSPLPAFSSLSPALEQSYRN